MSDDRTSEFLSIASSLGPNHTNNSMGGSYSSQQRQRPNSSSQKTAPKMTPLKTLAYNELKAFHAAASDIATDLAHTSQRLAELTSLVRTRTLFVDDSARVNALVLAIKSDIESLNARLEESQQVIRQQKRRLGDRSQAGQEADNIVGQLQEDFRKATTGFQTVLRRRSEWMQEQQARQRDVFGGTLHSSDNNNNNSSSNKDPLSFLGTKPPVYHNTSLLSAGAVPMLDLTSGLLDGTASSADPSLPRPDHVSSSSPSTTPHGLRNRQKNHDPYGYHTSTDDATHKTTTMLTPVEMRRLDEESGQTLQLIPDQSYLRERADAMTTVETNIVELGTIFNKLAVMVGEHREVVQRLEDNVNDADRHISLSMETLTDTLTNLSTNRALFGKLFGIAVIFIIMFITFFA